MNEYDDVPTERGWQGCFCGAQVIVVTAMIPNPNPRGIMAYVQERRAVLNLDDTEHVCTPYAAVEQMAASTSAKAKPSLRRVQVAEVPPPARGVVAL